MKAFFNKLLDVKGDIFSKCNVGLPHTRSSFLNLFMGSHAVRTMQALDDFHY